MDPKERATYIGGSDTAAILGISPWKTPLQLYLEKIGEEVEEITPEKQKIFNRGKRFEPVVAEMLLEEFANRGHDVEVVARNERHAHPEFGFLSAEIDLELIVDGEPLNAEIKTVHPFAARDWGEIHTDEIPVHYVAQCLHGQMVTGKNKTAVAALIGTDDLRLHYVHRDESLIKHIQRCELEFWRMIEKRIQPDPINPEDIMRLYEWDNGQPIQASQEVAEAVDNLKAIRIQIKNLEAGKVELEKELKLFMGENSLLLHDLVPLASWKAHKATRLDTKLLKAEYPELFDKYKKETTVRTFLIK